MFAICRSSKEDAKETREIVWLSHAVYECISAIPSNLYQLYIYK